MYCSHCGNKNPDDSLFCRFCGAALPAPEPKSATVLMQENSNSLAKWILFGLVFLIILSLAAGIIFAVSTFREVPAEELMDGITVPISEAADAVLYLEVYDGNGEFLGTGSGFMLDETTLVTNYHVIEDATTAYIFTSDAQTAIGKGTLMTFDEVADLALLRCDVSLNVPRLLLANSDEVHQGDPVYAVGYPLGIHTLSDGIVSSCYTDEYGVDVLQVTAAISQGSSGGALFNQNGHVIGVTCASYTDGQNMNVAITSNTLALLYASVGTPEMPSVEVPVQCKEHDFSTWTVLTESTCTESGKKTSSCTLCGEETFMDIPATGHQSITIPATPAGCTTEGISESSQCEICGAVISSGTVLPAMGHDYQDYVCSRCGANDPNKPTVVGDPLQGTWECYYWGSDGATLECVDVFFFSNGQFQFLRDMPFEENDKAHSGTYTFDGTTITFYVTAGDASSSSYTLTVSSIGSIAGGTFFTTSSGEYFWKV